MMDMGVCVCVGGGGLVNQDIRSRGSSSQQAMVKVREIFPVVVALQHLRRDSANGVMYSVFSFFFF